MTLKNLLGISLDAITPDKAQIAKLLSAAERNIADAGLKGLSTENRFDAAYKAILRAAMVALHAAGKVIVLDALRKQRNMTDYSGDLVSDAAAEECVASARELVAHVREWIAVHRPELI